MPALLLEVHGAMPLVFRCPECQKQLRVSDDQRGKKIRCPQCKAVTAAPDGDEPIVAAPIDDDEAFTPEQRSRPRPRDDEVADRDDDQDEANDLEERRPRRRRRPRDDELGDGTSETGPMPTSVVLAIVATCVLLGLELMLAVLSLAGAGLRREQRIVALVWAIIAVISGLVLWGLIARHRLAWQWGRILAMLGAILMVIALIIVVAAPRPEDPPAVRIIGAGIAFVFSSGLFTISISLGIASAKRYFGLRCPSCGRFTSQAADFFFNRAKCRRCDEVW
jgi:predicted Zn finger-like uncharacterized protein